MHDLSVLFSRLRAVQYMDVVSLTVLVYDYFLTFDREITLIWQSKWSTGKVLFFLARYPAFFDVPMVVYYSLTPGIRVDICLPLYCVVAWSTAFGIAMADAILVLQTYALWARSRWLLMFLIVLYVCIEVPVVTILAIFLRSLRYGPPPIPGMVGCFPTEGSNILVADFALLILHESIILVLTLWIGVKNYRHSRSALITSLYRNGIFYFVYLFLISAGNIIVILAGPPEFLDLLNTLQRVMHSLLSTRILLHVRQMTRPKDRLTSLSDRHFDGSSGPSSVGRTTDGISDIHAEPGPISA